MARGGKTQPKNPAPVSGPGALSRRTDSGPGSATQPIRVATGGDYGAAKASREQQQGAPLPATSEPNMPPVETPMPSPGGPPVPGGVFGPTARPHEPPTAGLTPSGQVPYDPDEAFRALYSVFPHPQILSLLRR